MTLGDLETLGLRPGDALFLDFDGTLAEIGPDPDAIRLPPSTHEDLEILAGHLGGALAVISGRDLRDLGSRVPAGLWRLGGHGIEVLPPGAAPPPTTMEPAEGLLAPLVDVASRPGVRLEIKGPVAAIHYRAAPDQEEACLAAAQAAARIVPGHVVQAGKMVVEVKPAAAHKGSSLTRLMQAPPFQGRRPIMLGDDTTDEDAMAVAAGLGGLAVKVGPGPSIATLRAPDPGAVRAWLAREGSGG
ncbi:trehalose-phosphatase [Rubellimicrobium arenae]|uniref:trehalose-phosphatase n=1 Tax=Rubellimicrobium arenae TaxID=2817372 RepID=UPI001B307CC4|nr:trehalose-phosphatase [Rubellimicrobium arenae]